MCFTEGRSSIWTLASYSLNTKMRHGSRDLKNNCYARNALSVLIVSTFIFRALSRLKIYSKFPSRTEIIKTSFPFSKQKAIQHLLRHLGLDSHFNPLSLLTYRETQILLAMCEDARCKILAQKFDVSVTTMSNHIAHIQEKIVSPFALHHVLSKLRTVGKKSYVEEL